MFDSDFNENVTSDSIVFDENTNTLFVNNKPIDLNALVSDIYTSDGTLTSNRVVTLAGWILNFVGANYPTVKVLSTTTTGGVISVGDTLGEMQIYTNRGSLFIWSTKLNKDILRYDAGVKKWTFFDPIKPAGIVDKNNTSGNTLDILTADGNGNIVWEDLDTMLTEYREDTLIWSKDNRAGTTYTINGGITWDDVKTLYDSIRVEVITGNTTSKDSFISFEVDTSFIINNRRFFFLPQSSTRNFLRLEIRNISTGNLVCTSSVRVAPISVKVVGIKKPNGKVRVSKLRTENIPITSVPATITPSLYSWEYIEIVLNTSVGAVSTVISKDSLISDPNRVITVPDQGGVSFALLNITTVGSDITIDMIQSPNTVSVSRCVLKG